MAQRIPRSRPVPSSSHAVARSTQVSAISVTIDDAVNLVPLTGATCATTECCAALTCVHKPVTAHKFHSFAKVARQGLVRVGRVRRQRPIERTKHAACKSQAFLRLLVLNATHVEALSQTPEIRLASITTFEHTWMPWSLLILPMIVATLCLMFRGATSMRLPPRYDLSDTNQTCHAWSQDLMLLWSLSTDLQPHQQAAVIISQLAGPARVLARLTQRLKKIPQNLPQRPVMTMIGKGKGKQRGKGNGVDQTRTRSRMVVAAPPGPTVPKRQPPQPPPPHRRSRGR